MAQQFTIHRDKRGWPKWYQKFIEAFSILTGRWSLHRAWQNGFDDGVKHEYVRVIQNMGEIDAQRRNVEKADASIKALTPIPDDSK